MKTDGLSSPLFLPQNTGPILELIFVFFFFFFSTFLLDPTIFMHILLPGLQYKNTNEKIAHLSSFYSLHNNRILPQNNEHKLPAPLHTPNALFRTQ